MSEAITHNNLQNWFELYWPGWRIVANPKRIRFTISLWGFWVFSDCINLPEGHVVLVAISSVTIKKMPVKRGNFVPYMIIPLMPSSIAGYEYDIFISYRHNDNRSSWVGVCKKPAGGIIRKNWLPCFRLHKVSAGQVGARGVKGFAKFPLLFSYKFV